MSDSPDLRPDLAPATRVVALGREDDAPGAQVGAPLVLTSTYRAGAASSAASGSSTVIARTPKPLRRGATA